MSGTFYGSKVMHTNDERDPRTRPDEEGLVNGKMPKVYWQVQVVSKAKWNEKHIAEEYYYRDPRIHQHKPAFTDTSKAFREDVKEQSQQEA